MPPITALLHTRNDALRLGRALETLLPCSEILIVDHDSTDATRRIARDYGARIIFAAADDAEHYLERAANDWVLGLDPHETITEGLQATLFEWITFPLSSITAPALSLFVSQQIDGLWEDFPTPATRIVPRNWTHWNGRLPAQETASMALEGRLLRLAFP